MKKVLAIDPGLSGAFVVTDGETYLRVWEMPFQQQGKDRVILFPRINMLLERIRAEYGRLHVFLERALPYAMGSKHAFNYGVGYAAILNSISTQGLPMTLVEPAKWTKDMHQGINGDLKPKAKSLIAVHRLYPQFINLIPKSPKKKALHDGVVDAILLGGWALRRFQVEPEDFF